MSSILTQMTCECRSGSLLAGAPCHSCAANTTVRETVRRLDTACAMDDVGDLKGVGSYEQARLLLQFPNGGGGNGLTWLVLANWQVPAAWGKSGHGPALD